MAVIKNAAIYAETREFPFSDREFSFLAGLVNKRTGIVLSAHKKDMVYSRLARRLRDLGLGNFADYCELIQSETDGEEIGKMVNAITTNLTKFFREEHHFLHLRDKVLLPIVGSNPQEKRLRIWSAACSSGMEAYSIAMIVKAAAKNMAAWDMRVLATDIDTNMLSIAREGKYPMEQLENIPPPYRLDVGCARGNDKINMSDSLKELIAFKQLNLLENWPMSGLFDAVFCRNVVIYFDKETQRRLFNRMADIIKPDGWLYIGHSENLHNVCDRFELIGRTIYRKIK